MRNVAALVVLLLVAVSCGSDPESGALEPGLTDNGGSVAPEPTVAGATQTTADVLSNPTVVLGPGEHAVDVAIDGGQRSYRLYIPDALADPSFTVMMLHGGGGPGSTLQDVIDLDHIADRDGFVVVYPEGSGVAGEPTWNAGHCCGQAAANDADHVAELDAVAEDLRRRVPEPARRIVVAGHSNGAMMAMRFAAETSVEIDAVVAVSGTALTDFVPSAPVPLLVVHSVDDPIVPYEGGAGPIPLDDDPVVGVPVVEVLDAWAAANGCVGDAVENRNAEIADGQASTTIEWTDCEAVTRHIRMSGVGHAWPGVNVVDEATVGPATTIVDASEVVSAFGRELFLAPAG